MTVFSTISGDASNGGLVGAASNCDSLVIERCSFTGNLHSNGSATNCGGFIGWSNVPVTIRQSLFDPADLVWYYLVRIGQNFARRIIDNMRKSVLFTLSLLCTMAQGVRAWDGSGTVENPYQIRNSADWQTLAAEVSNGNVAVGTAFRLMGDISITTPVGTSDHRFSGIFDGGGHTITASLSVPSGHTAPFAYVEDATISHLHVDGTIQGGKHTAGITSSVTGTDNRIEDCHVSADITTFIESGIVIAAGIVGHGNKY